jgi:hypothetical protein
VGMGLVYRVASGIGRQYMRSADIEAQLLGWLVVSYLSRGAGRVCLGLRPSGVRWEQFGVQYLIMCRLRRMRAGILFAAFCLSDPARAIW